MTTRQTIIDYIKNNNYTVKEYHDSTTIQISNQKKIIDITIDETTIILFSLKFSKPKFKTIDITEPNSLTTLLNHLQTELNNYSYIK